MEETGGGGRSGGGEVREGSNDLPKGVSSKLSLDPKSTES